MAYLAEPASGDHGRLTGGDADFPRSVTDHDWETPYPPFEAMPGFRWTRGELRRRPSVYRHSGIRDWIVDERAWRVFEDVAPGDLHLIARATVDGEPARIVQAAVILDVVDREHSIIDVYSTYEILRFPAFLESSRAEVARRVFRVPGSYVDVFVGEDLRAALDEAGIHGLNYAKVKFEEF
jgi:hypothetical protein